MFFAGGDDICGLNGDNGAIGVGNKSGVSDGIRVSGSIGVCGGNGSGNAVGGKVSLLSSSFHLAPVSSVTVNGVPHSDWRYSNGGLDIDKGSYIDICSQQDLTYNRFFG